MKSKWKAGRVKRKQFSIRRFKDLGDLNQLGLIELLIRFILYKGSRFKIFLLLFVVREKNSETSARGFVLIWKVTTSKVIVLVMTTTCKYSISKRKSIMGGMWRICVKSNDMHIYKNLQYKNTRKKRNNTFSNFYCISFCFFFTLLLPKGEWGGGVKIRPTL